jgi:signal transduction histidine kinase
MLLVPLSTANSFAGVKARAVLRSAFGLAGYGLCFALLRVWASEWATFGQFSLWFPAAGLRFAFLWWCSPRMVPFAALAEAAGGAAIGAIDLNMSPLAFLGTIGPCLVYGVVIAFLKRSPPSQEEDQFFNPMPFAAAAVVGSALAGLTALAWALPTIRIASPSELHDLVELLFVFALGDLLGILLLAPPLLALAAFAAARRLPKIARVASSVWLEIGGVLGFTWLLVWSLRELDYGLQIAPVVLGTCWAALRGGRLAAWLAILASAVIVLPFSAELSPVDRMHAHMLLTCIAAGGYVVGSYADAQARANAAIKRRDRLLYQAERLKTLRAMSLGVIHEINEPLATIALESSSLVSAAHSNVHGDAIRDMAERINRKANDLSDLVRRLRRFGSSGNEERSCTSARALISDVAKLAAPVALAAGVRIEPGNAPPAALLEISDVEMRQALLNLVRNAIDASREGKTPVVIRSSVRGDTLSIDVENQLTREATKEPGMRVGLLIARAIARAHGGSIGTDRPSDACFRQTLSLPIAGRSDEP